jgi:methylated-DNA-[protein]-cysteine S-methyltransferase
MTPLQQKTYDLLKTVPAGRVTTYKALADAAGTKAYRAIGQFMRHNPYAFESCDDPHTRIPCHRVVASDGTIGGFMGKRDGVEIAKKIALLKQEGIAIQENKVVNFPSLIFTFPTP